MQTKERYQNQFFFKLRIFTFLYTSVYMSPLGHFFGTKDEINLTIFHEIQSKFNLIIFHKNIVIIGYYNIQFH